METGSSLIFVGANGGGKTRLAVLIEDELGLAAHRISAHRALSMNTEVAKVKEDLALAGLRTGYPSADASIANRPGSRWHNQAATGQLNDFDFLIQALFANQAIVTQEFHQAHLAGNLISPPKTKLAELTSIWKKLLPSRTLLISGDDIQVQAAGHQPYKTAAMSDGERAIFYLIGQVLVAAKDSLLIVDEPELHIHRSIMSSLWDELEAVRPDCAIVFITHDLEFAGARVARKFVIQQYSPTPPTWTIEEVPEHAGFSESVATLILGSRRPVLFVEGDEESLDIAFYRACFPKWTVVAKGSCEQVIHSVASMRSNAALHRITCAGVVDADGNDPADIAYLAARGVYCLPVSEIENLVLLPNISSAILKTEGHVGAQLDSKLAATAAAVFAQLGSQAAIEAVVVQQVRRRLDRMMKKIDLSSSATVPDVRHEFQKQFALIDVDAIASEIRNRINTAKTANDLAALLVDYSNKGLMAIAASHLKATNKDAFVSWLTRVLVNGKSPELTAALQGALPAVTAA
jgi:ABC-type molybdenum transport system ATPase subunit/photorepair protein PhrA